MTVSKINESNDLVVIIRKMIDDSGINENSFYKFFKKVYCLSKR